MNVTKSANIDSDEFIKSVRMAGLQEVINLVNLYVEYRLSQILVSNPNDGMTMTSLTKIQGVRDFIIWVLEKEKECMANQKSN